MGNELEKTWNRYVSAWKGENAADRTAIFEQCLTADCVYSDPLIQAGGWDELGAYMADFNQQYPGVCFVVTHFQAHHDQSISKWVMQDGDGNAIGEGISYARYNAQGKLLMMSGFFETP